MKLKCLLIVGIFAAAEASASQKYLICSGKNSMTIKSVEEATGKETNFQEVIPWEHSSAYILEKNKLYDKEYDQIAGCKITRFSIKCDQDWKSNSYDPGFKWRFYLEINRISGAIKTTDVSHQKYNTKAATVATDITITSFEGYCELKGNTKF
jgi:hypothetical protein